MVRCWWMLHSKVILEDSQESEGEDNIRHPQQPRGWGPALAVDHQHLTKAIQKNLGGRYIVKACVSVTSKSGSLCGRKQKTLWHCCAFSGVSSSVVYFFFLYHTPRVYCNINQLLDMQCICFPSSCSALN